MSARHTTIIGMLVVLAATALSGCGSARRGAPIQPPLELSDPHRLQGQQVFMRYCNGCHPRGEAGIGLALNNKPLPGFLIRFQVRRGWGAMPGFSDEIISDDDLDALVAYMKTLRRHD